MGTIGEMDSPSARPWAVQRSVPVSVGQIDLLTDEVVEARTRPRGQVLKWVGNKFRYAEAIAKHLPSVKGIYYEPFVGTGAVLATIAPNRAVASDTLPMLIEIHEAVQDDPAPLVDHYLTWREAIVESGRGAYDETLARYNAGPNPADLLVLSRTCYGGVVRFTRSGTMSTPMGPHKPMPAEKLELIVEDWRERLTGTEFVCQDFAVTMALAGEGDVVYCDPPYLHGQTILYGAQDFRLPKLWAATKAAKERGAAVAVSVDGWRRSGAKLIELGLPPDLFARELIVERGGCMLRRFQMNGEDMALEQVADRLLLTW